MKITVRLESVPVSVEIIGTDESIVQMVDVATVTLEKLRKIYLDTIKRQTKLSVEHV